MKEKKATIEQLYEQLGNNFDITICSDIVNGLYFEYKQLYYENEQLKEKLQEKEDIIKKIKEEIRYLKSNCDISDIHSQKLEQILDNKENENENI